VTARRLSRRQFLLGAAAVAAGAAAGLAGYGYGLEPRRLQVERVEVPIPALPRHLDGFTIGVLADLHVGRLVPVDWVYAAARRLVRHQPDLVVVAGDMTGEVEGAAAAQQLVDEALAPVKGAYGVYGNWDIWYKHLPMGVKRQQTITMLENQGVLVAPDLWLAGLDEGIFGNPDVDKALAGAPEGAVRILLAHEPDLADRIRPEHRVALQISGHTHGGQVVLPGVGPVLRPALGKKYVAGLYRAPACRVYTSRGVGMSQLPVRFGCPPEITLLTLRRWEGAP
jgi:predicted MPP superfamily phosphohydrolase